MILLSGDKDFGGLIEFGTLWGRGKVILLRYRLIIIDRIAKNIAEVINNEKELFNNVIIKQLERLFMTNIIPNTQNQSQTK